MGIVSSQGLSNVSSAKGLTAQEADLVHDLVKVLIANTARNAERMSYYEGEEGLRNIGIAIPPELTSLSMSCSWPAKAVDALADRSVLDGVSFKDGDEPEGLTRILQANHLRAKYNKAKRTEGVHGVSFWTVTKGISERLPVLIRQHSAESSSGIWDDENQRLLAGLVVAAYDRRPGSMHKPTQVNVYTDQHVLIFHRSGNNKWMLQRLPHKMGRPLMEAMVYGATTSKPLGTSRISKAVMSITDCAIRESLRSEIHAEIFTSPQKYLLGASKKQVEKMTRYEAFFGSIFALQYDEDSPDPKFGQLSQASMEPHIAYMRQLAAQFSGATDIPISTLGVIHDNPSSADAIHAAEQPLVIKAETMNEDNAVALESVVKMAIAIMQDKALDELTPEEDGVVIGFRRPDRPSQSAMADAGLKIASTQGMEWFGGTDVFLEMIGFSEDERIRLKEEKRRSEGRQLVGAFMQNRGSIKPEEKAVTEEVSVEDNESDADEVS